jgi:glycosyltransferase involved in cell wall biosynthesis
VSAPLLSVVIPTRDRGPLLRQALVSVRSIARAGMDLETIVVDASGSDPAVPLLADEFGARLLNAPGANASRARNVGMEAARGTYLVFLDDDDVLLPEHLRPEIDLLETQPQLGGVFGQIRLADFELAEVGAPFPRASEVGDDVFRFFLARHQQIASLVVRTSVRDSVGLFDERLRSSEDWDWMLRVALHHDLRFVAVPGLLFRQRPFATSDRLDLMRLRYLRKVFWRNVRRAGRRRPPLPAVLRMFANHSGFRAGSFLRSSQVHARAGDMAAARFAFWGALASSPPHVVVDLARHPSLLTTIVRGHVGR